MTIEQYGSGEYVVLVTYDGFRGTYRFPTRDEADAFVQTNRGYNPPRRVRLTKSNKSEFTTQVS